MKEDEITTDRPRLVPTSRAQVRCLVGGHTE